MTVMENKEYGESDSVEISDKIEILSTEDEKIKAIGELLSSDSSRSILKTLFNESLTANQIAQKTGISLPLVIYHLKKMQEAGVIKISNVGLNTKSHDMKYYTVDKFAIVILPAVMTQKAKTSKSLFNSLNRIYRFASIGGAAIAAWFSSQFIQNANKIPTEDVTPSLAMDAQIPEAAEESFEASQAARAGEIIPQTTGDITADVFWSIIVVLSVIASGLIVERVLRAYNR
jgi:DNA-binding Lrp family transcriptional regulator